MSTDARVVCDKCGEVITTDSQRVRMVVSEYGELANPNQGYVVPDHRELDLHWTCYEETFMTLVRTTDR